MQAVGNLPPAQMQTALGSVSQSATNAVNTERQELASNPPQMERPSGVPANRNASAPPVQLPPPPPNLAPKKVDKTPTGEAVPVPEPPPLPAPPPSPTQATVAETADGRYQPTGVPPRSAKEFRILLDWIDDLGWRDEIPEVALLELGEERGGISMVDMFEDPLVAEIFGAGRDALVTIAGRLTAYDFFVQGQQRGMALPVIYAPEEVMEDVHFRARGFPVTLEHEGIGRPVTYAGAPFVMEASPWRLQRHAPRLGEHQERLQGGAGRDEEGER